MVYLDLFWTAVITNKDLKWAFWEKNHEKAKKTGYYLKKRLGVLENLAMILQNMGIVLYEKPMFLLRPISPSFAMSDHLQRQPHAWFSW